MSSITLSLLAGEAASCIVLYVRASGGRNGGRKKGLDRRANEEASFPSPPAVQRPRGPPSARWPG